MLTFLSEQAKRKGAEEFHLISKTKNSPVPKATECIWILSSRHDIEKQHVNCPKNSINYKPCSTSDIELDECDVEDDFLRIQAALEIGAKLLAKKEDPKHAPLIVYNGLPAQNASFRKILEGEGLKSVGLPEYPLSKILILDLDPDHYHTPGQFQSMAKECTSHPLLKNVNKPEAKITIVTSAYHGPRVRRLFDSKIVDQPFPRAQVTLHLIDREFKRPCIMRDLEGELNRIETYLGNGHIGEPRPANWFMANVNCWTPLRQKIQGNVGQLIEDYELRTGRKDDHFRFKP